MTLTNTPPLLRFDGLLNVRVLPARAAVGGAVHVRVVARPAPLACPRRCATRLRDRERTAFSGCCYDLRVVATKVVATKSFFSLIARFARALHRPYRALWHRLCRRFVCPRRCAVRFRDRERASKLGDRLVVATRPSRRRIEAPCCVAWLPLTRLALRRAAVGARLCRAVS